MKVKSESEQLREKKSDLHKSLDILESDKRNFNTLLRKANEKWFPNLDKINSIKYDLLKCETNINHLTEYVGVVQIRLNEIMDAPETEIKPVTKEQIIDNTLSHDMD